MLKTMATDIMDCGLENLNGITDCIEKLVTSNGKSIETKDNATVKAAEPILPRRSYSREFLMKLKTHPKSKEKPGSFNVIHMVSKSGLWDPEHWHGNDSKRPTSSTNVTSSTEEAQDKVRERLLVFM